MRSASELKGQYTADVGVHTDRAAPKFILLERVECHCAECAGLLIALQPDKSSGEGCAKWTNDPKIRGIC